MSQETTTVAESRCRYGFLYVLTNPCMPGLVKVGQTERHPRIRALEVSDHTGVPEPYVVTLYFEVTDRFEAEKVVMAALRDKRLANNREFFRIDVEAVLDLIEENAKTFLTDLRFRKTVEPAPSVSTPKWCGGCGQKYSQCTCPNKRAW